MPLSVVVAPDSFKGSMSAREVAEHLRAGWLEARPDDYVVTIPQADGGEGTLDAVEAAVPGALRHTVAGVTGPDGRPVDADWLELPDGTAVVELAASSGLPLMERLDALGATTRGLGELLVAALDAGARRLLIGLGGSASTDGGTGALRALGARFLDADGIELPEGGGALDRLARIDTSGLRALPEGGAVLLTDVTAPLTGPSGAAAVFGPQKGATAEQVRHLDAALTRLAAVGGGPPDAPGSGAAGGTGYGLAALWGATIESGAERLAQQSGLLDRLAAADVLVTGEGSFDEQSLGGKIVGSLLDGARRAGTRAVVIAGRVAVQTDAWTASLSELAGSSESAIADPAPWLREAARRAAHDIR